MSIRYLSQNKKTTSTFIHNTLHSLKLSHFLLNLSIHHQFLFLFHIKTHKILSLLSPLILHKPGNIHINYLPQYSHQIYTLLMSTLFIIQSNQIGYYMLVICHIPHYILLYYIHHLIYLIILFILHTISMHQCLQLIIFSQWFQSPSIHTLYIIIDILLIYVHIYNILQELFQQWHMNYIIIRTTTLQYLINLNTLISLTTKRCMQITHQSLQSLSQQSFIQKLLRINLQQIIPILTSQSIHIRYILHHTYYLLSCILLWILLCLFHRLFLFSQL